MLFGLLSWFPVIGPLVDGIVSMFSKWKDTDLAKYQTDADVRKTEVGASVQTLIAFKDDIGLRLLRDIGITPWVCWEALIGWDTIMAKHNPAWMWHVADVPSGVAYLPALTLTFLFGNLGLNMWRQR